MTIIVLDASEGAPERSWKRFLAYDRESTLKVLIRPQGSDCEYLRRIWNEDVYCAANWREAAVIVAYLRGEETATNAETTTIYL